VSEADSIFDHTVTFDPVGDFEAFLKQVPAKWVVYELADEAGRPIQLLCVKNLRYSLRHRLGSDEIIGPTRRVNYREIVRRIRWRRVDSAFEADVIYLEAARALFPQTYQGMVGFRPAWFLHVNPDANFPRYVKTTDLSPRDGVLIGPLEDKHSAGKFVEEIEDWFDLCRYWNILVESPNAKACAYKEMGKCPAPCDGTISLENYRRLIDLSVWTLTHPDEAVRQHKHRMANAAAEMRFEIAGKIKKYVEQLSQIGKGPLRHVRPISDFNYLTLQRGPREGTAKVFLITPGRVEEIAGLISEPLRPSELLRVAFTLASGRTATGVDSAGAERVGVVAQHLFTAKQSHGVFLPLESVDEKSITKAYRDLLKQKQQVEVIESEGVMKELQSL
jgi:excinuclease UvrABC nuclease subunit